MKTFIFNCRVSSTSIIISAEDFNDAYGELKDTVIVPEAYRCEDEDGQED